jgi:hypothetical protein
VLQTPPAATSSMAQSARTIFSEFEVPNQTGLTIDMMHLYLPLEYGAEAKEKSEPYSDKNMPPIGEINPSRMAAYIYTFNTNIEGATYLAI